MTQSLVNKNIVVGVSGSIAAYKSADLVRKLREAGASVRVVMTEHAKEFITPLTMQAVSGYPVHDQLFDLQAEAAMGHIELARWADVVLIAPATADCMARLTSGQANDLLTTLCLATSAPVAIAPAMNQGMWKHTLTQENLQALRRQGVHVFDPAEGVQACGDVGFGRMIEPEEIVRLTAALFKSGRLAGVRVLVSAGPTHEAIDPVRYITNGSSGKMGYALAEAAREAGAIVTLVSGPVHLAAPEYIECVQVTSAEEMYAAVMRKVVDCDMFLAVAAVGDYRAAVVLPQKMHKSEVEMQLTLKRNPDIVASVAALPAPPYIVGFAAETEKVIESAKLKRERKKMNMIIANHVQDGMGLDENAVVVIHGETEIVLPRESKPKLARQLMAIIGDAYCEHSKNIRIES